MLFHGISAVAGAVVSQKEMIYAWMARCKHIHLPQLPFVLIAVRCSHSICSQANMDIIVMSTTSYKHSSFCGAYTHATVANRNIVINKIPAENSIINRDGGIQTTKPLQISAFIFTFTFSIVIVSSKGSRFHSEECPR